MEPSPRQHQSAEDHGASSSKITSLRRRYPNPCRLSCVLKSNMEPSPHQLQSAEDHGASSCNVTSGLRRRYPDPSRYRQQVMEFLCRTGSHPLNGHQLSSALCCRGCMKLPGNAQYLFQCPKPAEKTCPHCHLLSFCSDPHSLSFCHGELCDLLSRLQLSASASGQRSVSGPSQSLNGPLQEYLSIKWETGCPIFQRNLFSLRNPPLPVYGLLHGSTSAVSDDQLPRNLRFFFPAAYDLRNVLLTVNQIPQDFRGHVTVCINSAISILAVRDLLMLELLRRYGTNGIDAAIAIWYSTALTETQDTMVILAIRRILGAAPADEMSRECHYNGTFSSSTKGSYLQADFGPATTKILTAMLNSSNDDLDDFKPSEHYWRPTDENNDLNMECLFPAHFASWHQYDTYGILVPFGAIGDNMTKPNRARYSTSLRFVARYSHDVLCGWDIPQLIESGKRQNVPRGDLYGCLFFHLREIMHEFLEQADRCCIQLRMTQLKPAELVKNLNKTEIKFHRIDACPLACGEKFTPHNVVKNAMADWTLTRTVKSLSKLLEKDASSAWPSLLLTADLNWTSRCASALEILHPSRVDSHMQSLAERAARYYDPRTLQHAPRRALICYMKDLHTECFVPYVDKLIEDEQVKEATGLKRNSVHRIMSFDGFPQLRTNPADRKPSVGEIKDALVAELITKHSKIQLSSVDEQVYLAEKQFKQINYFRVLFSGFTFLEEFQEWGWNSVAHGITAVDTAKQLSVAVWGNFPPPINTYFPGQRFRAWRGNGRLVLYDNLPHVKWPCSPEATPVNVHGYVPSVKPRVNEDDTTFIEGDDQDVTSGVEDGMETVPVLEGDIHKPDQYSAEVLRREEVEHANRQEVDRHTDTEVVTEARGEVQLDIPIGHDSTLGSMSEAESAIDNQNLLGPVRTSPAEPEVGVDVHEKFSQQHKRMWGDLPPPIKTYFPGRRFQVRRGNGRLVLYDNLPHVKWPSSPEANLVNYDGYVPSIAFRVTKDSTAFTVAGDQDVTTGDGMETVPVSEGDIHKPDESSTKLLRREEVEHTNRQEVYKHTYTEVEAEAQDIPIGKDSISRLMAEGGSANDNQDLLGPVRTSTAETVVGDVHTKFSQPINRMWWPMAWEHDSPQTHQETVVDGFGNVRSLSTVQRSEEEVNGAVAKVEIVADASSTTHESVDVELFPAETKDEVGETLVATAVDKVRNVQERAEDKEVMGVVEQHIERGNLQERMEDVEVKDAVEQQIGGGNLQERMDDVEVEQQREGGNLQEIMDDVDVEQQIEGGNLQERTEDVEIMNEVEQKIEGGNLPERMDDVEVKDAVKQQIEDGNLQETVEDEEVIRLHAQNIKGGNLQEPVEDEQQIEDGNLQEPEEDEEVIRLDEQNIEVPHSDRTADFDHFLKAWGFGMFSDGSFYWP